MQKVSSLVSKDISNYLTNRATWNLFYNAKSYDLVGNGTTNDYTALNTLINTTINGAEATIIFPAGTYKLSTSITIPSNISIYFVKGAMLSPDSGVTVTINGPVEADLWKIFTGSGTIAGSMKVDEVYPQWWGAVGDGVTNDAASIQAAIDAAYAAGGVVVYHPRGSYYLGSTEINLKSNVTIDGPRNVAKFISSKTSGRIFYGNQVSNVTVRNLYFEAASNAVMAIQLYKCVNILVEKCKTYKVKLVSANSDFLDIGYAAVTDAHLTDGYYVIDNVCLGTDKTAGYAAIDLHYVKNAIIKGNKIKTFKDGIQWWGGDSDGNGAITNPRWCYDVVIEGNIIDDIGLGGIWGSMGERITIVGNTVTNCGDVGIDVEGSFFCVVASNVVNNCTNGCYTTFYLNKGIVFDGNTAYSSVNGQYMLKIYNDSVSQNNKDIRVCNNQFIHTGTGLGYVGGDNCETLDIINNTMTNAIINTLATGSVTNHRFTKIEGNQIILNNVAASAVNAVYAGKNNNNGTLSISKNNISSTVAQPAGSRAIYAHQTDFNSAPVTTIDDNVISSGFTIDIEILSDSANAGIYPAFFLRRNIVTTQNFVRTEGATLRSIYILEGNRKWSGDPYPTGVPVSGKWDQGTIFYRYLPAAGTYVGDICTAGGTPGTWKGFGAIQA